MPGGFGLRDTRCLPGGDSGVRREFSGIEPVESRRPYRRAEDMARSPETAEQQAKWKAVAAPGWWLYGMAIGFPRAV
jgi:3-methyladenine DNA glycosylase/8-oxoguanine DNA glycosylase